MKKQYDLNRVLMIAAGVIMISGATFVAAGDPQQPGVKDSLAIASDSVLSGRLLVTYFHGNARCVTCRKMEAYAEEALDSSFAAQLADSSIEWRTVNFDEDGNDHFLKDYQLFGQALILSHMVDGKEKTWKNLDKIWVLVGDKDKYQAYVRDELTSFFAEQKK